MDKQGLQHPFTAQSEQRSRSTTPPTPIPQQGVFPASLPTQEGSVSWQHNKSQIVSLKLSTASQSLDTSATNAVIHKLQHSTGGAGQPDGQLGQASICADPECPTKSLAIGFSHSGVHDNYREDNREERYSRRSIGVLRFEKQFKTSKLTTPNMDAYSYKISQKHRFFSAQLYITPAVTDPGKTEERAKLTICTQIARNVKCIDNAESFKILVSTEVCDRISGERLDDQNRLPPTQTMSSKGFVRYSQDLIQCKRLNTEACRNDSVTVVFKIQVFVTSNFKYTTLEESTDIVMIFN